MDYEKLNNMIPETISLVDRQLLINQCKILSIFGDAQEKVLYERRIEILEKGYTGLYQKVFNTLYEEVPISTYQEVENILKMYNRINDSIRYLNDEDKELLDLGSLEFEGFDVNGGMHYYMMSYLVDRMDEYHEYKGRELKSHTNSSLSKYNKMLPIHTEFEQLKKDRYSTSDLQKFIEAVTVKMN
ncbi:YfbU family protein [Dyadobacter sp. CY345]|uniref:YfbU family protein n=1 Tax=Dyadobacter sp. CY345 TaxID=2909335 RepID=UPI001F1742A2|nr:YfbU family protein [Dyadobacter sp. CY345]MCF2443582.1 YfbU family protein [Dyadobacter sp. CY345]